MTLQGYPRQIFGTSHIKSGVYPERVFEVHTAGFRAVAATGLWKGRCAPARRIFLERDGVSASGLCDSTEVYPRYLTFSSYPSARSATCFWRFPKRGFREFYNDFQGIFATCFLKIIVKVSGSLETKFRGERGNRKILEQVSRFHLRTIFRTA